MRINKDDLYEIYNFDEKYNGEVVSIIGMAEKGLIVAEQGTQVLRTTRNSPRVSIVLDYGIVNGIRLITDVIGESCLRPINQPEVDEFIECLINQELVA